MNLFDNWRQFIAPTPGICSIGEGEGGGDGGGGGGSGGEGENQLPEGMNDDMAKFMDQRIHSALGVHLTRFRSSFEKDLDKKLEAGFSPLNEQLGSIGEFIQNQKKSQQQNGQNGANGHNGQGAPAIPQEWEARFSDMQKKYEGRINELEEKNRQEANAREQERMERLQTEEKHALSSALANAGIEGSRARAAMSLLYTEDKRVTRNDDGDIVFLVPKAGYVDQVTLDEGITDWLKTEDGKAFLPPRGAGGSGGKGSQHRRGQKPPSKAEKQAQAKVQLAEIMGVLPAGTGEGI